MVVLDATFIGAIRMVQKFLQQLKHLRFGKKQAQKAFSTMVIAISTPQLYLITSMSNPKMPGMHRTI